MTPSTTNTAARELSDTDLATLLVARCIDTNSERAEFKLHGVTDAGKEVGDWIVTVSTLTQQQGGEQEAVDGLPTKWRAEAGAFGGTCSDRDRGYARTLCQLADELDREFPFITYAGWQAIETAPRDGSKVLLAWPDGVCAGWFQQRTSNQSRSPWRRDLFGLGDTRVGAEPTHWMPLPSGPATAIVSRWREQALAGFGYSNSSYESGHISGKRHCADELEAALRSKQPAASAGDKYLDQLCHVVHALTGDEGEDDPLTVLERYAANGATLTYPDDDNTSKQAAGEAVAYAEAEYEFEVWQDDFVQAGGTAPTVEEVMTEAGHYAMMYGQDGPVRVRYYERREFKPIDAALQEGTP